MKSPTFSILTPVYNVAAFLPACLESVLAQTFTDWELILVDDGSTDNSGKICDEYAAKYPGKIKVFHNTNHGLLYTRRYALTKAQGKYYVTLDSDDKLSSNALKIIYNKFQEYNCDCVIYGLAKIRQNGQIISTTHDKEIHFTDKRLLYRLIFLNHTYNPLWRKAVKSSMITHVDYSAYYHISLTEDLLQTLEILHNCQTAVLIPDVLYYYVQNESSITHTVKSKALQLSFQVREQVLDFITKEQVFTRKDMQEYHDYCMQLFKNQIYQVLTHPATFKQKVQLFEEIKKHSYYKNFLNAKKYRRYSHPLYWQFRLGWYRMLVLEVNLYIFLKKVLFLYL